MSSADPRQNLKWLGQLRWWAMAAAMTGVVVAVAAKWPFVSPPGLLSGVFAGLALNGLLTVRSRRGTQVSPTEIELHIVVDLVLLSWFLAFSGGIRNPLTMIYSFHVVLGALLAGKRGTLVAVGTSLVGLLGLFALEAVGWLPSEPIHEPPAFLWVTSLSTLLIGLSYFSLVLSQRLFDEREAAHEKRLEAERSLSLLNDSLDALQVGLEVVDEERGVLLRNPFAQDLRRRLRQQGTLAEFEQLLGQRGAERVTGEGGSNLLQRFSVEDEKGQARLFDVLGLLSRSDVKLSTYLFVDRTEERLVEARHVMLERLATLGRALQGLAHELNTPLTTMQTLAKDLLRATKSASLSNEQRRDFQESLELVVEESRRCRSLTQALLATGHSEAAPASGENLYRLAQRAIRLVGHRLVDDEPTEGTDDVVLNGSLKRVHIIRRSDRVLQILMNLIQNALKATEQVRDGPRLRIDAHTDAAGVIIRISDHGPGLPDEVRERLFEPFVTTRPMGEGTGLGLYTSRMIAQELGGTLSLDEAEGGGTQAALRLPPGAFNLTMVR